MERRAFLAFSGTAGCTLLAGCLGDEQSLPEDTETVLDTIPESVGGESVLTVYVLRSQAGDTQALGTKLISDLEEQYGVSSGAIDLFGVANVGGFNKGISVVTGSFTAAELSEPQGNTATDKQDGLLISATDDDDPWEEGLMAAQAATDDPEAGLISSPAKRLVEPLADDAFITASPSPQEWLSAEVIDESIEMYAYSQTTVDETTEQVRYSMLFESESAVSDSLVRDVVETDSEQSDSGDIEYTQDGRQVVVEITRESSPDDSS